MGVSSQRLLSDSGSKSTGRGAQCAQRVALLLLGALSCIVVQQVLPSKGTSSTHRKSSWTLVTSQTTGQRDSTVPDTLNHTAAPTPAPGLEPSVNPLLVGNDTSSQQADEPAAATAVAAFGPPPYRFPKLIHQTVKDKSRLSCEEKRVIDSWKRLNPGYTHKLWDDEEMRAFIVEHYPELVPVPYDELLNRAERPDMWRVLVLHQYGGVYADMDVECMRPIDEWNAEHDHDAALLLGTENFDAKRKPHHIHVNNFAIASMPGHPLLGLFPQVVMRQVQRQYFAAARKQGHISSAAYESGILDRTGPAALTTALYEHFSSHGVDLNAFSQADVNSKEGVMAAGVRVLPNAALSSGWEVAAARQRGERLSCADLAKRHPQALVCHMFWGSWRSQWGFRQRLTYDC